MDQDLIDMLAAWRGAELAPARFEQLLGRLRRDEAFRKEAAEEICMLGMLKAVQAAEPRWLELKEALDLGSVGQPPEGERGEAFLQRVRGFRHRRAPGSWGSWALAAAAVLALAVGLGWRLWPRGARQVPVAARTSPPLAPPTVLDGLAMVVKLQGVRWDPADGPPPAEGALLKPRRLRLRSGRATLAFLKGVVLTLEGPADLELVSIDRVFCHRGKIRLRVPGGAEGFVVSAPGSNVVDLGTDLGINVGDDGKTRVMVFEGMAEAEVLGSSGSSLRSRLVPEHRTMEIDPLGFRLEEVPERPENFVTSPRLAIPPLELASEYRGAVLEAGPWGYWRFESMDAGAVPNEVVGRPPLRVTGPLGLAGTGNRSVAFEEGPVEKYLLMDGRWTPPREPGYAVELWFCTARFGLAELADLFVPRGESDYSPIFQLELTSQGPDWHLFRRVSIRFLHRWPPSLWGGDNLFFDHYALYRWHHVVSQVRDDRMELFVDGKAFPPLSIRPERETAPCQLIVGQLKPLPRRTDRGESRPFVGQIDELALYDRPLSAEEVQRHYALGIPGGRPSVP